MTRKNARAESADAAPGVDDTAPVVRFLPIDQVAPYKRNARTHSPEQVAQIAASLREFGWTNPELVDESGGLIAGHGRIAAARQVYAEGGALRMSNGAAIPAGCVPVLYALGWTEAQKRAYVLADNKLALNAEWDDDLLKVELADLKALDFDLSMTGFAPLELDSIFAAPNDPAPLRPSLADRFMIPPFSVLNAREGWWQDRKRAWIALGIQSEIGRGGNLIGRSIFERCAVLLSGKLGGGTGRSYDAVRAWVLEQRAAGLTDEQIDAEARRLAGAPEAGASGGRMNAVRINVGGGGLADRLANGERGAINKSSSFADQDKLDAIRKGKGRRAAAQRAGS